MRCWFISFAFCVVLPGLSSAHELWLEPKSWAYASGDEVRADIVNGEKFKGSALVWLERNVARAELAFGDALSPISGRAGDRPALVARAEGGLGVLIYETTPSRLTYQSWEKFAAFSDHKDLNITREAHLAAGHPETGFVETYSRHAKSLLAGEGGLGADRAYGLETEFVALSNPYAPDFSGEMFVRLFYQGAPRSNAQVEVFERKRDGTVSISTTRTDADGLARVAVRGESEYLFDAVVLRPGDGDGVIYHTLWAALTFYVP